MCSVHTLYSHHIKPSVLDTATGVVLSAEENTNCHCSHQGCQQVRILSCIVASLMYKHVQYMLFLLYVSPEHICTYNYLPTIYQIIFKPKNCNTASKSVLAVLFPKFL